MKFKFDQIAINSTAKKKPEPEDAANYIGLEHLTPGTFEISEWGSSVAPVGEKLLMKKGDVLFGRRRAYQRKVGIAPFDGIFSAHGMVLRPRTEVVDENYFPFFISSDQFMNEAVRISVGSLSPTINWGTLKNCEFDLPPMEEQKKLAELLWAANDLKEKYKKAVTATDEMLKAKFRAMFGCVGNGERGMGNGENFNAETQRRREGESGLAAKNAEIAKSKWPVVKLDEVAPSRLGKMLDAKKQTGMHLRPYLANVNVQWFRFDLSNLRQMDFNEDDRREFSLIDGDLLVCEGGEVGRCAIWHNHMPECYFQKAIHRVRCDKNRLLPEYLAWWFKRKSEDGYFNTKGTTIDHLPSEKLKKLEISLPPLSLQREFVAIAEKAEAAKTALKKSIADIDQVMKGLINQR